MTSEFQPRSRSKLGHFYPGGVGVALALGITASMNVLHLYPPIFGLQIFNRVLATGSMSTLAVLAGLLVWLTLWIIVLDAARAMVLARIGAKLREYLDHINAEGVADGNAPARRFAARQTLSTFVAGPVMAALLDAPFACVFVVAIFTLDFLLGLTTVVAIATFGVGAWLTYAVGRSRSEAVGAERDAISALEASLAVGPVLNAMGGRARLAVSVGTLRNHSSALLFGQMERQGWVDALTRGTRILAQGTILVVGAYLVIVQEAQVGIIIAASMFYARAVGPLDRIASSASLIWSMVGVLREVRQCGGAIVQPRPLALPRIREMLLAEHLTVRSPSSALPILRDVSLRIDAGTLVSIVGPQGAGKSTLARLLAGASRPDLGDVRADGVRLSDYDPVQLGDQVGFLPDDDQLGCGTVASIIARGSEPDADAIVEAAKLAGAHQTISRLPAGYQTMIGVGVSLLSAGERRQIALARAFYRRPSIVVLDDPTIHLDDEGEHALVGAVSTLVEGGSLVVVVSRHASLMQIADQLVMLDRGSIVLRKTGQDIKSFLGPRSGAQRTGITAENRKASPAA